MSDINSVLRRDGLLIRSNPCISPDFCLDWSGLQGRLATAKRYEASAFETAEGAWLLAEDVETGDHAWLLKAKSDGAKTCLKHGVDAGEFRAFPCTWENLLALKCLVLAHDEGATIFPTASGTLKHSSLGIGARFTTMHWPAADWSMAHLGLSLTANQNSIPRELVYDVNEMLAGRLDSVPFKFIGGVVPEGHQGQSVQGMSHGAVLAKLKHGFHLHRLPWGFNADHQPIGGKFDAREDTLVSGCILATYITFDLSPELALDRPAVPAAEAAAWVAAHVHEGVNKAVRGALAKFGFNAVDETDRLLYSVWPALLKMKQRDTKYQAARDAAFPAGIARKYFRELSIDELPGLTTPETLLTMLTACQALEMPVDFVAPAFGFQKNFPFDDNALLETRVTAAWSICKEHGVSIGFHSGSGKSAENYTRVGRITGGRLEIKTSGRYTYEMGVALAASPNPADQALWKDWYNFTRNLALGSAFSGNGDEQEMARQFISHALRKDGRSEEGVFASADACKAVLESLSPDPDHMFWFEYNFLYVLAAGGSHAKAALGDHTKAGYDQRARFYAVSPEGRLLFAKGVARYIIFLAETTGLSDPSRCQIARDRLNALSSLEAFLADISPINNERFVANQTVTLAQIGKFATHTHYLLRAPPADHALVRVRRIGLCGTDYKGFEGKQPFFSYPRVLGHELSVEVVETAPNAHGITTGARCAVEPYVNCTRCIACRHNKGNCCTGLSVMGVHMDGGMREYMYVPTRKLHASASLSHDALVLVEPLCIGAHAVARGQIQSDDVVLVVGAGPIGTGVAIFALATGARLIVMDVLEERLRLFKEKLVGNVSYINVAAGDPMRALAGLTNGDFPTVVVDATGNINSMKACFDYVANGGRIVFVGLCKDPVTFDDPLFHRKELTILGSRNALGADFKHVIALAERGVVDLPSWITHRSSLAAFQGVFTTWALPESNVLKAVVEL